jgi:hypothetical protein
MGEGDQVPPVTAERPKRQRKPKISNSRPARIAFSTETAHALHAVASYCAQDMEYEYASDPEVVAETAMDASRLTMSGYPNADKEVGELIKKFGYDAVLKAAAKIVPSA